MTVDVLTSYTIVNCLFFSKHNHLSCCVEYGEDCDNLMHKKEKTVVNGSDVSLLLFHQTDILPSTDYCYIVTADNGSHSIKVDGSFRGEYDMATSTISWAELGVVLSFNIVLFTIMHSFTTMVTVI